MVARFASNRQFRFACAHLGLGHWILDGARVQLRWCRYEFGLEGVLCSKGCAMFEIRFLD